MAIYRQLTALASFSIAFEPMKKWPETPIDIRKNIKEAAFQYTRRFLLANPSDSTREIAKHVSAPRRTTFETSEYW